MPGPSFATVNVVDCVLKEEAGGYGAGGSLSASLDGFELWLESKIPSLLEMGYLEEGDMGLQMGGLAEVVSVVPAGVWCKGTLPFFFRGPGAAYSASVQSVLHRVLKGAGFDAVGSFGAGTESYVYTPTPEGSTPTSLFLKGMDRGEEVTCDGVFANLKFEASTAKPWKFMIEWIGRRTSDVVARALGAVTYPYQTIAIPIGAPANIALGSYLTAVVRSISYDHGRSIENARPNLNTAGFHAGYQPGPRKPRLTVLIEATSLVGSPYHTSAGLNIYKLRELATQIAVTAQIGATQYNKAAFSWPKCQLVGAPQRVESNGSACWQMVLAPRPSTPVASDDVSITTA